MREGPRVSSFAVGAVVLALIAIGSWAVFTRYNPFADPFKVQAAFTGPTQARIGTPVRLAGVEIGKVTDIQEGPEQDTSIVEMEIEEEGLPLREDATFKVRPRLFLEGNYFIEASPGTPHAAELDDGSVVPATQTAGPVSAGDFLKIFESNTRDDVRSVLSEYGRALDGGGAAAFNRSTRYWEKAYGNSAKVNEAALGQRDGDLSGYIRNSGRVASALSRNEGQLRDLVTNLAETGGAFARQQAALSAAIGELPRTLNQGFRTLGVVDRALPPVRALARELTPAVRTSPATLDASIPLARELRGIIGQKELGGVARSLSVAAPALARFARGGVGLQGQQRLLASCLNNVSLPTSEATVPDPIFPATGPVYQEFVKWMPGLAGGARSFDANAIYSRSIASTANFTYPVGRRVWFNTQPLRGINPAPAALPPLRPTVPCETQEPPDLGSRPLPPPPGIKTQPDAPGEIAAFAAAMKRAQKPLEQVARDAGLAEDEAPRLLRPDELDEAVRNARGAR